MFQTSSCDRKLPTHGKCHAEFWADFLFLFPFSPLSHFFFFKVYSKAAARTVFLCCCSDDITPFPSSPLSPDQSLPSFPWTVAVPSSMSFSPYTCFFSPTATQDCYFWCLGVEVSYLSVLWTKRVFLCLYPRLFQVSSKPTSGIYSCSRTY